MILLIQVIAIIALIAVALAYYFGFKRANKSAEKFWKQALQIIIDVHNDSIKTQKDSDFDYKQL